MRSQIEGQLKAQLESRKTRSLLRSLVVIPESSADFSSNDFLGLARNPALGSRFLKELASFPKHSPPLGSTGSRLLDGNSRYAEDLEVIIANFHHAEAALIFNSGFDANVGFFSSVPQPGDVILYDEYIHASVHDGMKVSRAGVKKAFLHNDLHHLAELLQNIRREDGERAAVSSESPKERNIFVAVESVYSMDGDTAPLREIVDLLEPHAALVGPKILKDYLINYARPLIYSTFTSFSNLASVKSAYEMLISGETVKLVESVRGLITYFRSNIQIPEHMLLPSTSPIQGIIMDGNAKVNALSQQLIRAGLNVKPIRFPTVPKGKERVRICLHSHNTQEQVEQLIQIVQAWIQEDRATMSVTMPAILSISPSTELPVTEEQKPSLQSTSTPSLSSSRPALSMSTLSAKPVRPLHSKL
ncbi:hypothetical protein BGZ58_006018 [Dissophora ornata]|nr:hypothetical protein BGZ58_006018 [Dissophora ornata]